MNKILLITSFCVFSILVNAQTEIKTLLTPAASNKYLIKLNTSVTYNIVTVSDILKEICASTSVNYNTTSGYFEVFTKRKLNKEVIIGKMQKNATPIDVFMFSGQVIDIENSVITNTLSAE